MEWLGKLMEVHKGVGIQGFGKMELEVESRKKLWSRACVSIWSKENPVKIEKFELKCIFVPLGK